MADTTTMSDTFQISIPETVRISLDWKVGQEFALISKGKGVLLVPVPAIDDLYGNARGADSTAYRDRTDRY